MPLLMCPNDNAPMQTMARSGVEFDMCPTCRGVWLDRGELEKLMAAGSDAAPAPQAQPYPPQQPQQQSQPWGGDRRPDHDRDQRHYGDDNRYKHKKRDSIFDIFD